MDDERRWNAIETVEMTDDDMREGGKWKGDYYFHHETKNNLWR